MKNPQLAVPPPKPLSRSKQKILELLQQGSKTAQELLEESGYGKCAVYEALAFLKEENYITTRPIGNGGQFVILYQIKPRRLFENGLSVKQATIRNQILQRCSTTSWVTTKALCEQMDFSLKAIRAEVKKMHIEDLLDRTEVGVPGSHTWKVLYRKRKG